MPAQTVTKALTEIEKDKSKLLGLVFPKREPGASSSEFVEPGQFVSAQEASSPPTLYFRSASPDKTYIVICLDLDAPFPSLTIGSPVNHWIQSGFRTVRSDKDGKLETSEPFIVNWAAPGPPPISAPHRYLFLLYEQPIEFDISAHAPGKEVGIKGRPWFNLDAWEQKIGLSEAVAANYFKSKGRKTSS